MSAFDPKRTSTVRRISRPARFGDLKIEYAPEAAEPFNLY